MQRLPGIVTQASPLYQAAQALQVGAVATLVALGAKPSDADTVVSGGGAWLIMSISFSARAC